MGFSKKLQVDSGLDSEGKKWVIAGMTTRGSLKAINTKPARGKEKHEEDDEVDTPTAKEARIAVKMGCPGAPRKKKAASICNFGTTDFFIPPDLESVFNFRFEKLS